MNVETAILAELNIIVSGLLVIRKDEDRPSSAASRIAASPSKRSKVRKMKISEIEMYESNRKNRTTIREPSARVTSTSRRYGRPSSVGRMAPIDHTTAAAPAATTACI